MRSLQSSVNRAAFGVDVGGTNIKAGFVDERGNLLFQERIQTKKLSDMTALLQWVREVFSKGLKTVGTCCEAMPAIGFGLPGSVREGMFTLQLTNIPWGELNFPSMIEIEGKSFACLLANDGNLAALSEYATRREMDLKSLLFIGIGTGLGGGWIHHGKFFAGATGSNSELGHIKVIDDRTFLCGCGAYGCLESIVSAKGIRNLTEKYLQKELRPRDFFLLKDKSEANQAAYQVFIDSLAVGLRNAVVCFDPELVVIGGGIAGSADIFLPDVRERFAAFAYKKQQNISIEASRLGKHAGLIGASLYPFLHT